MPNLPFKYRPVLTKRAKIFTVDHNGQNYFARLLTAKSLMLSKFGATPPKRRISTIVSTVSLKPLIVYVSCGPLLGCGCPLTSRLGTKRDARQIYT
jgi:hypothetical protein